MDEQRANQLPGRVKTKKEYVFDCMITPKPLTPIKAIRAKCLDCCAGQRKEVHICHLTDCSLHPYRMGRRPASPATTRELVATFAGSDGAED